MRGGQRQQSVFALLKCLRRSTVTAAKAAGAQLQIQVAVSDDLRRRKRCGMRRRCTKVCSTWPQTVTALRPTDYKTITRVLPLSCREWWDVDCFSHMVHFSSHVPLPPALRMHAVFQWRVECPCSHCAVTRLRTARRPAPVLPMEFVIAFVAVRF